MAAKIASHKISLSSLASLANAQTRNLEAISHYGLISDKQINLVVKLSFMQLHILFVTQVVFHYARLEERNPTFIKRVCH